MKAGGIVSDDLRRIACEAVHPSLFHESVAQEIRDQCSRVTAALEAERLAHHCEMHDEPLRFCKLDILESERDSARKQAVLECAELARQSGARLLNAMRERFGLDEKESSNG